MPTRPDDPSGRGGNVEDAGASGEARARRMVGPVAVLVGLALASVALHVRNPHREGSWGICPWRELTGTDCPGCGGLRAVNDLTNLRLFDAASSNLAFVAALPLVAVGYLRWVGTAWTGVARRTRQLSPATWSLLVTGTIVVWWVVRNLPGLEWLRSGPALG